MHARSARLAGATRSQLYAGSGSVFVRSRDARAPFGHDLAPHLRTGMTVVICPGSCGGALAFKRAAGLAVHDDSILVGETSTLPYACRADGDGNVQALAIHEVEMVDGRFQKVEGTERELPSDLVFLAICTPRFTPDCYQDLDAKDE